MEVIILLISFAIVAGVLYKNYKFRIKQSTGYQYAKSNQNIIKRYGYPLLKFITIILSILFTLLIIKACASKQFLKLEQNKLNSDIKSLVYFYSLCPDNPPPRYNEQLEKF